MLGSTIFENHKWNAIKIVYLLSIKLRESSKIMSLKITLLGISELEGVEEAE